MNVHSPKADRTIGSSTSRVPQSRDNSAKMKRKRDSSQSGTQKIEEWYRILSRTKMEEVQNKIDHYIKMYPKIPSRTEQRALWYEFRVECARVAESNLVEEIQKTQMLSNELLRIKNELHDQAQKYQSLLAENKNLRCDESEVEQKLREDKKKLKRELKKCNEQLLQQRKRKTGLVNELKNRETEIKNLQRQLEERFIELRRRKPKLLNQERDLRNEADHACLLRDYLSMKTEYSKRLRELKTKKVKIESLESEKRRLRKKLKTEEVKFESKKRETKENFDMKFKRYESKLLKGMHEQKKKKETEIKNLKRQLEKRDSELRSTKSEFERESKKQKPEQKFITFL